MNDPVAVLVRTTSDTQLPKLRVGGQVSYKTRPDTQLPQSRVGGQGQYFSF